MEQVDPLGYRAISSQWHTICASNIDPMDLGQRLIQQRLINPLLIEQAMNERSRSSRVHAILDGIVRNGDPRAFEIFLDVTGSEASTRWLSKALEGGCDIYNKRLILFTHRLNGRTLWFTFSLHVRLVQGSSPWGHVPALWCSIWA